MPHRLRLVTIAASLALALGDAAAQDAPQPSFAEFIDGVRADALARGIRRETLDTALGDLSAEPVVVARDRAQPEEIQSLESYVARRLTTRTAATANRMAVRHQTLLAKVEAEYGVPPAVMVAIWGLESNFGGFTGTYPTVKALATLAYDGRRPLFRRELLDALAILDRGEVELADLKGSWAGAMGQPQFMPSSFLRHAVDFDRNGERNIWTSLPDVFGSMGNYLRERGWTKGERWGREVRASRDVIARVERDIPMRAEGCRAIREMTEPRPLGDWKKLGITQADASPLPTADMPASLVRGARRNFLVYRNYEAILEYNCSHAYAVTVGLLADRITLR